MKSNMHISNRNPVHKGVHGGQLVETERRTQSADRNSEIIGRVGSGEDHAAIAASLGLSEVHVKAIAWANVLRRATGYDVLIPTREQPIARLRQALMLALSVDGHQLAVIADAVGLSNHTTVSHGIKRARGDAELSAIASALPNGDHVQVAACFGGSVKSILSVLNSGLPNRSAAKVCGVPRKMVALVASIAAGEHRRGRPRMTGRDCAIVARAEAGEPTHQICAEYRVSQQTVDRVLSISRRLKAMGGAASAGMKSEVSNG